MKLLILLLLSITFVTEAVEDTKDSDDSSLVSSLLAKIQQLQEKLVGKPTERQTREVKKPSKDDPSKVTTYIRWGNSTCPYGANTIYKGAAAGGHYSHKGSPVNLICLPPNPMRLPSNQNQGGYYYAYGVEYQVGGKLNQANERNMPCAVCEVIGKSATLMIPSHYQCPPGWRTEYNGFIMAGHYNQEGSSMYNCIDASVEQIRSSGGDHGGHQLYTIYSVSGQFLPYISGYAMTCVLCTK